jgi:hypothetical protein
MNFNFLRNRFSGMDDDTSMPSRTGMLDPRRNMYGQDQDQPSIVPRPSSIETANTANAPMSSTSALAPEPESSPEMDMFEAGVNVFGGGSNTDEDGEGDSGTDEEDETETGQVAAGSNIYQPPPPRGPSTGGPSFTDMFKMASEAEPGEAEKRYSDFLSKGAPSREDYRPGKLDRLSAILGGASEGYQRGAGAGIKTARDVLERPYEQGLRDYETKAKTLAESARIEGATFGRRASLARTAATQGAADRRIAEQQALHEELFKKWGADSAAKAASLQGVNYTVDQNTGNMIATYRKPDGTWTSWVGPKLGQTPSEKQKADFDLWAKKEGIEQTNRIAAARATSGFTLDREKQMAEINAGIQEARDNKNKAAERQLIIDRAVVQMGARSAEEQEIHRKQINQMIGIKDKYGKAAEEYFVINEDGIPTALKPGNPNDPVYQGIYEFLHPESKKK